MLTEEQIKTLKPGDSLIIDATLLKIDADGDIWITVPGRAASWFPPNSVSLPSDSRSSSVENQPKYDPYRKFKKGDIVRVVAWNGRDIARIGQIGRVASDEYNSKVELAIDGWSTDVYYPVCHLELATPVEELEPYSLLETDTTNGFDIMRDGLCVMTFPYGSKEAGYYRNKLAAKEAAEAEVARLNAEWRKENKND